MRDERPEDEAARPDAGATDQGTLFRQIESIIADAADDEGVEDALEQICTLLLDEIPDYNWVGFYYVDPERPRVLTQGPFAGEPQDRVEIAFGQGVCGRAAEAADVFVMPDATAARSREISHPGMRAEIAAPVLDGETVAGVLNVESIRPAVFDQRDRAFLRQVGELTGPLMARWARQL